ncbi:methyltransferase [Metarhizium brunneum]
MTLGVPSPMHTQRFKFLSNQEILGWNAIKSRSEQLGLSMSDDQYKILTAKIKQMADIRPLAIDDTDPIIRAHHHELKTPA